jgi:hypothetical protein
LNIFSSSGSRPASLEIFLPPPPSALHNSSQFNNVSQPGGYDQATIDLILTTFIYLEKRRSDKERRRRRGGAGGGVGSSAGDGGGGGV